MKKILMTTFMTLIVLLNCTVPVFATNTDPIDNTEVVEETTEVSGTGWVHINIDVEANRPEDFRDYNFFINIINEDTGEWNVIDVFYDNNYYAKAELPYGKYYVAEAGVENDVTWKFALQTGQKFELSEETATAGLDLGFKSNNTSAPVETPDVEEPIVEEKNLLILMLDNLAYPVDGKVTVNLTNENGDKFSIVLSSDNQYVAEQTLPAGTYTIDANTSSVEGQDTKTVATTDTLVVTDDDKCVASLQLINRDGTVTETPNGDEIQEPSVQDPNTAKKNGTRITLIVTSGIILLAVVAIGIWRIYKLW